MYFLPQLLSPLFLTLILFILFFHPCNTKSLSVRLDHSLFSPSSNSIVEWKPKCEFELDLDNKKFNNLKTFQQELLSSKDPDNEFYALRLMQENRLLFERKYPACWFGNANETLSIHIDEKMNIFSFDLLVPSTQMCDTKPRTFSSLQPRINIVPPINLPTPSFVKRMKVSKKTPPARQESSDTQDEPESVAEEAPVEEEKSFIKKYWMYIVPVLILFLISGKDEPAAAENAGQARGST